jgi:signal peptidase I
MASICLRRGERFVEDTLASLLIIISLLFCLLLVSAWVLARAARALGSPRGRIRVGLAAAAILLVVGILFAGLSAATASEKSARSTLVVLGLLLIELTAIFLVLRYAFALGMKRTFALFGVHLGIGVLELILAIFIVRPFIIEAFVIRTRSMSPTLNSDDRFVANRLIRPRRLDLVAYRSPTENAIYCKRLIGLPGERLRFEGGGLYINDQPIGLPSVIAGRCHASLPGFPQPRYTDGQTIQLGDDEFFFIGDNVNISGDSRLQGPSHASSLVGVGDLIYWPLSAVRIVR